MSFTKTEQMRYQCHTVLFRKYHAFKDNKNFDTSILKLVQRHVSVYRLNLIVVFEINSWRIMNYLIKYQYALIFFSFSVYSTTIMMLQFMRIEKLSLKTDTYYESLLEHIRNAIPS